MIKFQHFIFLTEECTALLHKQTMYLFNHSSITGVAKLLDSPSHFSKFEIFRKPQLNMYLKVRQKKVLKITEVIFIENI